MYADISIHSSTLEVMMRFQDGRIYKEGPITNTITYLLFVMEYHEDVDLGSVINDEESKQRYIKEFEDGVSYFLQIDDFLRKENAYPMKQLLETMVIGGTNLITMGMFLVRRNEMGQISRILNNYIKCATEEDREEWQPKYSDFCEKVMQIIDNEDNKRSELELKEKMTKYIKWAIIVLVIWYIFF